MCILVRMMFQNNIGAKLWILSVAKLQLTGRAILDSSTMNCPIHSAKSGSVYICCSEVHWIETIPSDFVFAQGDLFILSDSSCFITY